MSPTVRLRIFLTGVLRYRYPPCCCLRFALDRDEINEINSCYERGIRCSRRRDEEWIPCHWFHKPHFIAGPHADPDDLQFDHMLRVSDSPAAHRFVERAAQL